MPPIPIIAPQPRRLLPQPTIIDPSMPTLPINLDDPFICHTAAPKNAQLPRLMSPIRIHKRVKRSLTSQSPTPCSSIKRQVGCPPRTPRRRRHNIRAEAIIAPRVINFDSLPWISALDDPTLTLGNPWDSDLSQLASAEYMRAPGLGPVRRRKSISLSRDRAEPLVPLVSPPLNATSTPPPRFSSPSRVQFFGLMPTMTPARPAMH
ncbi:hypothetical protein B0F90DRAFT_1665867 [Multifurca ochricompacta]|uniref:Uncharacterized protein n=1 Tax=Multifurca ochricompacta TaxID=376703 RepID=A0AAD4MBM6_9AGAM|nr:hypothetical protein B0F90DRAFT_1665867 [Multifurca ochricompacta]